MPEEVNREKTFEQRCLEIYENVPQKALEGIIPIIDLIRRFKKKPPIPKKEKLAKIIYPSLGDKIIMLHGVSVGEIISLENLIHKIKEYFPDYKMIITTGTVTGQELAYKKYSNICDFITYFPLDTYKTVERFLTSLKPSIILIAETELWPNFAKCANNLNIPLYIINGRISDDSYPSYLRFRGFLAPILSNYKGIFCQSEVDKNRFISLGAKEDSVEVMKNLKFEIEKKTYDLDLKKGNYRVFVAGSTHKGEDEIVLNVYKKLKENHPYLKLLLAPRHLTRLDEIKKLLRKSGMGFGFRSRDDDFKAKDIIILDTLGELSKVYYIADFAFIGGSFNKTGGHNPLEATIYSKPVISGPSVKNFRDIYSILTRDEAAVIVKNEREFFNHADNLLSNNEYYEKICANCKKSFQNQQGALEFIINKLGEKLK